MVVARKDDFCARIDRLVHRLDGFRGRVAMRGRDAGDLSRELRRAIQRRVDGGTRRCQSLHLLLERFDLRRRLGGVRARLLTAEGKLASASTRSRHRADTRLRSAAARLDALSPLAVLGRGYAVCWNADRTAVLRDAAAVATGDRVRVTLARGELDCNVIDRSNN
jgi:exodeoxyribonuclease VII large subunit